MRLRSSDPDLSAKGREQAEALKFKMIRELPSGSQVSLWVSPLHRTLLTAQPTAKALNVSPVVDTELFELYGCFEEIDGKNTPVSGKTRSEIESEFPEYDASNVHPSGWYFNKDFETHQDCVSRASHLITRLQNEALRLQNDDVDDADEHNIIIVSHGNFLSEVLKSFLGTKDNVGYSCGNASVTKLTLMCTADDAKLTAVSVGYIFAVDHLEGKSKDLVSGTNTKGLYV